MRAHLQARILQSLFRIEAPKELLDERPKGSGAEQIGDFLFNMDESSFDEEEPRELQHSCLETEAAGRLFDRWSGLRQRFQKRLCVHAQGLAERECELWTANSDARMD